MSRSSTRNRKTDLFKDFRTTRRTPLFIDNQIIMTFVPDSKLLGKAGFDDLLEFLAKRPKAGRIIQDTGGLRKVRFARPR